MNTWNNQCKSSNFVAQVTELRSIRGCHLLCLSWESQPNLFWTRGHQSPLEAVLHFPYSVCHHPNTAQGQLIRTRWSPKCLIQLANCTAGTKRCLCKALRSSLLPCHIKAHPSASSTSNQTGNILPPCSLEVTCSLPFSPFSKHMIDNIKKKKLFCKKTWTYPKHHSKEAE